MDFYDNIIMGNKLTIWRSNMKRKTKDDLINSIGMLILVAFIVGVFIMISTVVVSCSKEIEKSRFGQKVEYWLGDPNKGETK